VTETNRCQRGARIKLPNKAAPEGAKILRQPNAYELAFRTVTARRFCDQHEMSLQTATAFLA